MFSSNEPNRFAIQIVANKYNPSNYWAGRWRSEYTVDLNFNTLQGQILVNVHYYEQGNVSLNTAEFLATILPGPTVDNTQRLNRSARRCSGGVTCNQRIQDLGPHRDGGRQLSDITE